MQLFNDEALIALLKSSIKTERNKALSYIYENYYGGLARFVIDNKGTEEDAKDIFQDSLVVLYEKVHIPDFVWTSTLKTYLFAVCKNLWFKRLRKASNREIPTEDIHHLPVADISFDDPYEDRTFLLHNLMDRLGGACKEILTLFYFQRRSMQEIAIEMNLATEKVAKNKKARCMAKLRELFKESSDFRPL